MHTAALMWTAVAIAVALVVSVAHLATKVQRLDRVNQALLTGAVPSSKVRQLARTRGSRVEAMTAYRDETGADARVALAVVRGLELLGG